jgi:hypothetical protein
LRRFMRESFPSAAGCVKGTMTAGTTLFYPAPDVFASGANGSPFFCASRSQNATPREGPLRAPCANWLMHLKNVVIISISPKYFDLLRSDLTQFQPATHANKARRNLKTGREVPEMKSRSRLQTAVSRRYQGDPILP